VFIEFPFRRAAKNDKYQVAPHNEHHSPIHATDSMLDVHNGVFVFTEGEVTSQSHDTIAILWVYHDIMR